MKACIIFVALVLYITEVHLRQVYLGCFDSRGLPTVQFKSDDLTVDACVESCSAEGYRYAGLHIYQCRCGNSTDIRSRSRSGCTSPCPGDNSQICGGRNQSSVYAIVRYTEVYLGCYRDRYPRVLNKGYSTAADTVNTCVEHCDHLGYKFAGLQYSTECRCGNSEYHTPSKEKKCIHACYGNDSQICGGDWHNSVYEIVYPSSKTTTSAAVQTTKIPNTAMTTTTNSVFISISSTKHAGTPTTAFGKPTGTTIYVQTTQTSATNEANANLNMMRNGNDNKTDNSKTTIYPYIGVGVAVFVLICVLVAVLLIWRRRKRMTADRRKSSNNVPLQSVEPEQIPNTSSVPHVEVNGDSYACAVNRPFGGNRDPLHVQNEIGDTDLYMNCDPTQATDRRHDLPTAAIDSDDLVYSLAEPVGNDLVVVDNELYGS